LTFLPSRLTSAYASFLSVVFWIRFWCCWWSRGLASSRCVSWLKFGFGRRWCCCDWSQFILLDVVPDVVGFLPWWMVSPVCLSWYPFAYVRMSKIVVRLWIPVVDGILVCSQESCLVECCVARPRFLFVTARPSCLFHDVGWMLKFLEVVILRNGCFLFVLFLIVVVLRLFPG